MKPASLPIIDNGGTVRIIDDSGDTPKWKTLATIFPASEQKAKEVLRKHNLTGGWLFDGVEKRWIDA